MPHPYPCTAPTAQPWPSHMFAHGRDVAGVQPVTLCTDWGCPCVGGRGASAMSSGPHSLGAREEGGTGEVPSTRLTPRTWSPEQERKRQRTGRPERALLPHRLLFGPRWFHPANPLPPPQGLRGSPTEQTEPWDLLGKAEPYHNRQRIGNYSRDKQASAAAIQLSCPQSPRCPGPGTGQGPGGQLRGCLLLQGKAWQGAAEHCPSADAAWGVSEHWAPLPSRQLPELQVRF